MSTKATTLNSKKSVGALVKDWMSLVGIAILIVVFSIISYVKFGAQYFLTWSNWKNILLQSSTVAIVALGQSIMLLTGKLPAETDKVVWESWEFEVVDMDGKIIDKIQATKLEEPLLELPSEE